MGAGEITAICATLATIAAGFGGGLWQAGKAICDFARPYIVGFFEAHKNLVDTLAETQVKQCNSLKVLEEASSRHEEMHIKTGEKLDKIIVHLSSKDIPIHGSGT